MRTSTSLYIFKTLRPLFAAALLGATALAFSVAPAQANVADKPAHKHQTLLLQPQPAPAKTSKSPSLRDNHRSYNPMTGNFEETGLFGPRSNK